MWECTSTCGTPHSGVVPGATTMGAGSSGSKRQNAWEPTPYGSPSTTSSMMAIFPSAGPSPLRSRRVPPACALGRPLPSYPCTPPSRWPSRSPSLTSSAGGRVEPGFGVGYRKPEYLAFGGDFKHRYGVYAERIRDPRRLWGEEPGPVRTVTPPPIQRPIPMWGGFGGPMGAHTAGQLGVGLLSIDATLLAPYREGLAAGHHPSSAARLAGQFEFFVSDDPERTWADIGDHVMYRWTSYNHYMFEGTRREAEAPQDFDSAAISERFLIGTPEQIAAAIRGRIGDLPVTDVYGWSDYPGLPDEMIDRHLELTFSQLAPLLR